MYRTALALPSRVVIASFRRTFHTSPIAAKTVTEKAKEVAKDVSSRSHCVICKLPAGLTSKQVNLKVGKTLAGAIETGEVITEKAKEKTTETLGKRGSPM